MIVPSRNRMPSHSPPAGQRREVTFVSGPRTVTVVLPLSLVTTISQWLMAIERKGPPCSLLARQIRSTNGESDGRSSSLKIIGLSRRVEFVDQFSGRSGRPHDLPIGVTDQPSSRSKPSSPGFPSASFGPAMYPSRDIDL